MAEKKQLPPLPKQAFINRAVEQKFLHDYLKSIPNAVLFLYGPKSCGKTSLIEKVYESLDLERYSVNYIDLREVLIYDFKSFLNIFFPKSLRQKAQDIMSGITLSVGFFGLDASEESFLAENAFGLMRAKLASANRRGVKPILIIDEIQLLKTIYVNGERKLLDELFNLFIKLTKTAHIAHVICSTSDSYFIEELYQHAKMSKTCEFYKVDHLDHDTVTEWLTGEQLDNKSIEVIWDAFGGSPWEIWQVLATIRNGKTLEDAVEQWLQVIYSRTLLFLIGLSPEKRSLCDTVNKAILQHGVCKEICFDYGVLELAIEQDIWFYDPYTISITPNSQSILRAFEKIYR